MLSLADTSDLFRNRAQEEKTPGYGKPNVHVANCYIWLFTFGFFSSCAHPKNNGYEKDHSCQLRKTLYPLFMW